MFGIVYRSNLRARYTHRMKLFSRILVIMGALVLLAMGTVWYWLYYYTADLPSIADLSQYNPVIASELKRPPNSLTHVIPGEQMGKYLLNALVAAEGQPETRGPIRMAIVDLLSESLHPGAQMYSWQLARGQIVRNREIHRQIDELRLADQIQRHFSQQQVLTIYLNRVHLVGDTYGVEDASILYFGKHAAELSLDEAALLAGLIRSPNHDSPVKHPDRAVERRNWVIDRMISQGTVSEEEAKQARAAPLLIEQVGFQ